jgi:hypothetical protein
LVGGGGRAAGDFLMKEEEGRSRPVRKEKTEEITRHKDQK